MNSGLHRSRGLVEGETEVTESTVMQLRIPMPSGRVVVVDFPWPATEADTLLVEKVFQPWFDMVKREARVRDVKVRSALPTSEEQPKT